MSLEPTSFLSAIVTHSGQRLPVVVSAFQMLFQSSWPEIGSVRVLAGVAPTTPPLEIARLLQKVFDDAHAAFPTVAFWWKDEDSRFLGACRRLGPPG